MNLARLTLLLTVVSAFGLTGCSGSDTPDLGKVQGLVTLDGAPYGNARVTFSPAKGRPSEGVTNSEGKYELTYIPEVKGAELGEHTVTITTQYQAPENPDGGAPFKDPIPNKYNVSSTLKATVVEGENQHDFPLVSK